MPATSGSEASRWRRGAPRGRRRGRPSRARRGRARRGTTPAGCPGAARSPRAPRRPRRRSTATSNPTTTQSRSIESINDDGSRRAGARASTSFPAATNAVPPFASRGDEDECGERGGGDRQRDGLPRIAARADDPEPRRTTARAASTTSSGTSRDGRAGERDRDTRLIDGLDHDSGDRDEEECEGRIAGLPRSCFDAGSPSRRPMIGDPSGAGLPRSSGSFDAHRLPHGHLAAGRRRACDPRPGVRPVPRRARARGRRDHDG